MPPMVVQKGRRGPNHWERWCKALPSECKRPDHGWLHDHEHLPWMSLTQSLWEFNTESTEKRPTSNCSEPQVQSETKAVLNKGVSTGTPYISESHLSWLDGSRLGFSLEYPTVSLHAISGPKCLSMKNLYVMVNSKFGEEIKESLADEEQEDSVDDVVPITEFRFVPSDKPALEEMFIAMYECQALHSYPENEFSDDYDAEEYDVEVHQQERLLNAMGVDITPTVAGQFGDADVDH
nr:LOW QUALITY PROTEIN: methylosome subunit pICln-like [Cavia porcellus]